MKPEGKGAGRPVCVVLQRQRFRLSIIVELTGFEPATSSSRTKRATSLRYSSMFSRGSLYTPRPLWQAEFEFFPAHAVKKAARCAPGGC